MLASIGAYLLVAASYLQARITDDGVIYYDFMRRLVGEDVHAYAYQFGVVFWNLPFYVLSRIVRIANDDDWIDHVLIGAVGVAVHVCDSRGGQHLPRQGQRQRDDVGRTAPGEHLDRLRHLECVPGCEPQRRVHRREQGDGAHSGGRTEPDHRLGEAGAPGRRPS